MKCLATPNCENEAATIRLDKTVIHKGSRAYGKCHECYKAEINWIKRQRILKINTNRDKLKNRNWTDPIIAAFKIEFAFRKNLSKTSTYAVLKEMGIESGIGMKILNNWLKKGLIENEKETEGAES